MDYCWVQQYSMLQLEDRASGQLLAYLLEFLSQCFQRLTVLIGFYVHMLRNLSCRKVYYSFHYIYAVLEQCQSAKAQALDP
jgi:hypothetical protein